VDARPGARVAPGVGSGGGDVIATLVAVARAAVAVTLVASGSAKLGDVRSFAETVRGVGVPRRYARALGGAVALVETTLGALALAGLWVRAVDAAMLAMLLLFAGIAVYAWRTSPDLRCRCFGSLSDSRFGRRTLLRTVALAAVAALVVVAEGFELPRYGGASTPRALLVVAALALALVCTQAARTLDIVQRRTPSP
jgi:uncharacterized membrane protein YphA (DoxX/SURF4 family)